MGIRTGEFLSDALITIHIKKNKFISNRRKPMKKTVKKDGTKANKTLNELAEYWKQLERKTVEQRRKADNYYENILMEPIIQEFV